MSNSRPFCPAPPPFRKKEQKIPGGIFIAYLLMKATCNKTAHESQICYNVLKSTSALCCIPRKPIRLLLRLNSSLPVPNPRKNHPVPGNATRPPEAKNYVRRQVQQPQSTPRQESTTPLACQPTSALLCVARKPIRLPLRLNSSLPVPNPGRDHPNPVPGNATRPPEAKNYVRRQVQQPQ